MILIVDFGSQTAHLIGRRIRDFGVPVEIISPENALTSIRTLNPKGLIFSGGPSSVFEKGAPKIDKKVYGLGIPILGICYGWQLTAHLLGGEVKSGKKEYGPTTLKITDFSDLFYGLPDTTRVFESHGTSVYKMPTNYQVLASTGSVEYAAVRGGGGKVFGVQFHPEMHHSKHGRQILKNFITRICNIGVRPQRININSLVEEIRKKVGSHKVIGAFSGGTDSAVAGTLVARAIGKQFIPIYIDSGLMREETIDQIKNNCPKLL